MFTQQSQPPDSLHLLQAFSYAAAKFSRCFQLRVPGKAAQQPEGPGSGTAAGGGPRGANSVLSLPSEPCPFGSGRQGEAAILCPAPHRPRKHEGPSSPTCLHLPIDTLCC